MDIVSGVASVAQLIEYSASATRYLINLHKAVQEGPAFCRDKSQDIRFLLGCINRVCKIETPDLDAILPLYIAITNIASKLLNLLAPRSVLGNHWLWIRKREQIRKGFCALEEKAALLRLYLAERTYALVSGMNKNSGGGSDAVSKSLFPDLAFNANLARIKQTSLGLRWALPLPFQGQQSKAPGYLLKLNSRISPLSLASSAFEVAASR